ncbi:NarL family two-component system response regulator LiaR [Chitinivorax tropicus]|uniref:NarL family two-component system response regulator LiaR n=1 Tax=Chitinivorax tropicus TaxID=714531 RepID=A0A840MHV3_9PROT|nr:response regulator transcription factor [Chitinivorax tropicus]MBB5016769.1 NarL family two-component system response regulator LiaR [Chitinivorax tropicus]
MISVLICDDHAVVRYGIAAVLDAQGTFRLVGAVDHAERAISLAATTRPDVVLMDLLLPGCNGVQATREIRRASPQSKVMLLTSHEGEEYLLEAMQAGALSYWLKRASPDELVRAIESTARGEAALHPKIAGAVIRAMRQSTEPHGPTLTERETEVLQLIADGLSNALIASQLGLSEKTVKNHVSHILEKLELSDRTQAAVYAWREGIKTR